MHPVFDVGERLLESTPEKASRCSSRSMVDSSAPWCGHRRKPDRADHQNAAPMSRREKRVLDGGLIRAPVCAPRAIPSGAINGRCRQQKNDREPSDKASRQSAIAPSRLRKGAGRNLRERLTRLSHGVVLRMLIRGA